MLGFVILFLIGFGLMVAGGITLIAYLNFLPAGITWTEYFLFIKGRIESYFIFIGFIFINIALRLFYKFDEK
jgi:hypothetical protein